jgi:hypothetical protein
MSPTLTSRTPEAVEPGGRGPGVLYCMGYVPVAQVILDEAGVTPFVGEGVACAVPQHVRVYMNCEAGALAYFTKQVIHGLPG